MDNLTVYHGTQNLVSSIEHFIVSDLSENPGGFHAGTLSQAQMRMHPRGSLLQIDITLPLSARGTRLKDMGGDWAPRLKRAARAGCKIAVYLNRWENISAERAIELAQYSAEKIEKLSDRNFLKLVPEAQDSWIILDPTIVVAMSLIPHSKRS